MPATWDAGQGLHPAPALARTAPVWLLGIVATQNAGHATCPRPGYAKDSPEPSPQKSPGARIPSGTRCAQKTLDHPYLAQCLLSKHPELASTQESTNAPVQVLVDLTAV